MYIEGCRYFAGLRPVRAVRTLFDLNLPQRVCRPFRMGFPVKLPGGRLEGFRHRAGLYGL